MATFHSNIKPMKELSPATLLRTQRLIRMGEWLERNAATICLAFEVMDRAHDKLLEQDDKEIATDDLIQMVASEQISAIRALYPILGEINRYNDWGAEMGQDVTLHQPNACKDCRYEVVIEAPKPFEATAQQIADLPVAEDTMESFNNLMDLGQRIIDRGKEIADS